jgi:hypothetical protein
MLPCAEGGGGWGVPSSAYLLAFVADLKAAGGKAMANHDEKTALGLA